MKMDAIRLVGSTTIDFPLSSENAPGPFVLKGAEGLGPTEMSVRMGRALSGKSVYQGRSSALRQITLLVGLNPEWDQGQTPEELRTMLYSMVGPDDDAELTFQIMYQGDAQAQTKGYISKVEVSVFTKDPAVQIVINCDYEFFEDLTEFRPQPTVNSADGSFVIQNIGTAPSGFWMSVTLLSVPSPSSDLIFSNDRGGRISIRGVTWNVGDKFSVDTRFGSRGAWAYRTNGAGSILSTESILNNIDTSVSSWLSVKGGENKFSLNVSSYEFDMTDSFDVFSYIPAYRGV